MYRGDISRIRSSPDLLELKDLLVVRWEALDVRIELDIVSDFLQPRESLCFRDGVAHNDGAALLDTVQQLGRRVGDKVVVACLRDALPLCGSAIILLLISPK